MNGSVSLYLSRRFRFASGGRFGVDQLPAHLQHPLPPIRPRQFLEVEKLRLFADRHRELLHV
jgi:hypothetical protein